MIEKETALKTKEETTMTTRQIIMAAALIVTVGIGIPAAKKIMRPGEFRRYLVHLLFTILFWLWFIFGTDVFIR